MFAGRSCEPLNVILLNGNIPGEARNESTIIPGSTPSIAMSDIPDAYAMNATTANVATYINATIGLHATINSNTSNISVKPEIVATYNTNITNKYDNTTVVGAIINNNSTTDSDVTSQYNAGSSMLPTKNILDSYGGPGIITNGLFEDNVTIVCNEGHYARLTKLATFWAICHYNGTWSYDTCISEL